MSKNRQPLFFNLHLISKKAQIGLTLQCKKRVMIETYFNGIPLAITVSDKEGKIVYMNDKSTKVFEKQGGKSLLNTNLFECHSVISQEKIKNMMTDNSTNAYTIEKNGIKKMIFQTPWYLNNEVNGMVEFSFEIPVEMPHFKRI